MVKKILAILLVLWLGMATVAQAEERRLILRVDGLACPFCAYGLEKKILAFPGATSYDADLKKGEVYVGFESEEPPPMDEIKQAVREAGFTLRGMRVSGESEE